MPLLRNDAAFRDNVAGVPHRHEFAFQSVAASQHCVIISRAVGATCRQLLAQGYDTKGFRIHGKSCDWGPMAGFVMRDPRLSEAGAGGAVYNSHEHEEAFTDKASEADWTASTTPLRLFQARVDWLRATGRITVVPKGSDRLEGRATHPSGVAFNYSLIKLTNPGPAQGMWGVYLDRTTNAVLHNAARTTGFEQERGDAVIKYDTKYGSMYEPLLAMTNPIEHRHFREEHPLNAITGDYDLFAIWPYARGANRYDRNGADRRVLGTVQAWSERENIAKRLELNFTEDFQRPPRPGAMPVQIGEFASQGTKLGNMTNRIYEVSQFLNSTIGGMRSEEGGPFPRRNVLWHSDEAARPFVSDVDLPLIAFTPARNSVAIRTIPEFREFIALCLAEGFRVNLAEGWVLEPTAQQPNRLGAGYARHVPANWAKQWLVPPWYNA
ncbi:MAG: anthrax toxin-like adenylyl cyclase domain-containing protein [Roseococcus sp.]